MAIGGKSRNKKPQRGGRNQRFTNRADRTRGELGEVTRAWTKDEEDSEEDSEEESGSDSSNGSENSDEEGSGDAVEKVSPVKEKAAREPIVDIENPNRASKKDTAKASDLIDAPHELSRKEREEKEKGEAKARYWKLHMQGKTEQAQSDLARLAIIKKQREEAAKQREAEKKAKEDEAKAKKTQR